MELVAVVLEPDAPGNPGEVDLGDEPPAPIADDVLALRSWKAPRVEQPEDMGFFLASRTGSGAVGRQCHLQPLATTHTAGAQLRRPNLAVAAQPPADRRVDQPVQ